MVKMINKIETPKTRPSSGIADKKKKTKSKSAKESQNQTEENITYLEDKLEPPTKPQSLLFINALKKLHSEKERAQEQGKLFDDGERVLLQITGIKLPKDDRKQFLRIALPNCCVAEPRDVCLFVKDLEKGLKIDHESTLNHFNELLAAKGIDNITQVISLRELKTEYKQYEAKNSLCQKFDIFLVDERILRLVPMFLGKPFYKKKRIPVPVNLKAMDLKKEFATAINTVTLPLSHHGTCSMLQLGNTNMESLNLVDNLIRVNEVLTKRYPGGWKNIRAQHIKTETSMSIPIYVNSLPTNDVGFVDADVPKKIKRESVSGELSTIPGVHVTVTPSGHIKVVKTADPEWDDEEKDEPFIDGSEDEQDEKVVDQDKALGDKPKKRKKKNEDKGSKNKKSKKNTNSDSEDEDINESEKIYMNKVARQDAENPDGEEEEEKEEIRSDKHESDEEEQPASLEDLENESDTDNGEKMDSDDELEEQKDNESVSEDGSIHDEEDSNDDEIDEKFDDQQEIDEEDVIVDSDDDENEEGPEIANMDKHLMKKAAPVIEEEEEKIITKPKVKKITKTERRRNIKQQKKALNNEQQMKKHTK